MCFGFLTSMKECVVTYPIMPILANQHRGQSMSRNGKISIHTYITTTVPFRHVLASWCLNWTLDNSVANDTIHRLEIGDLENNRSRKVVGHFACETMFAPSFDGVHAVRSAGKLRRHVDFYAGLWLGM